MVSHRKTSNTGRVRLDIVPQTMQWDEDAFYYDDETLDYYRELFAE